MEAPKLNLIRKELQELPKEVLAEYCLRLAKYKTENKELLNFLLFFNEREDDYVEDVKKLLDEDFKKLPYSDYTCTKVLRKTIRIMNKHIKFMGNKVFELDLGIHFCQLFLNTGISHTSHKPLIGLLYRQLKRIYKLIPKLDEDLQFDYQQEFDALITEVKTQRNYFSMQDIQ